MSELIRVTNATFGYNRTPLLKDVTLTINTHEFIGIVGANGAGKTTLFRGLVGLLAPLAGRIERDPILRHRVGYVPQRDDLDSIYPVTAYDVVEMGLVGALPWYRFPHQDAGRRIRASLEQVGMWDHARRPFAELSGGQRQRVLLARAIVIDPVLLVLDEPTTGIDVQAEENILLILKSLHQDGKSILIVSHHDQALRRYCTRILEVDAPKVAGFG